MFKRLFNLFRRSPKRESETFYLVEFPDGTWAVRLRDGQYIAEKPSGYLRRTVSPAYCRVDPRKEAEERAAMWIKGITVHPFTPTVVLAALLLASCSTTRPVTAYVRPDGTRVGVSKNVVFLRGYDTNEGIAVAQDAADITAVDSITTKRRVRAFGSSFITTVTGK